MAKISVIIPVYNAELYIKECLESVINQTIDDIEIICIDDCGVDNSIKIVEQYAQKDSRIKIIKYKGNRGVGPARNIGIYTATGDFTIFLDSDDYFIENDILEKLYKKAIKTNADFAMFNYDNWKNEFSEKLAISNDTLKVTLKNFNKVLNNFPIVVWGKLFKTSFLKKKNLLFINTKDIHEDVGFTMKLLSTFPKYTCIPDTGIFYRKNPTSIMSTLKKEKSKKSILNNFEDAFTYIRINCSEQKQLINKISNSYRYARYLNPYKKLFRFCWEKYDKHLEIFYLNIIKEKIIDNKLVTKLLGITISLKNI